jgi:hypothetical protein
MFLIEFLTIDLRLSQGPCCGAFLSNPLFGREKFALQVTEIKVVVGSTSALQ